MFLKGQGSELCHQPSGQQEKRPKRWLQAQK